MWEALGHSAVLSAFPARVRPDKGPEAGWSLVGGCGRRDGRGSGVGGQRLCSLVPSGVSVVGMTDWAR